jgi:hypothetical protein
MNKRSFGAGVVVLAFALILMGDGCTDIPAPSASSYQKETYKVEQTQQDLISSTPIPTLNRSVERENIAARAKTFDVQNKTGYIYLVNYGKVMAFYSVKGKVSSLNSYLSPMDKLVDGDGKPCVNYYVGDGGYKPCYSVIAPDIDGAYGENADGIFFFTTEGDYVEWKGDYMFTDQPLKLSTQPELVRQVQ